MSKESCDTCAVFDACSGARKGKESCNWWPGDRFEPLQNMHGLKFDPQSRYYDQGGIEVQEIIRAKLTPEQYEGFCLGNIIKYSCRANFKGQFDRDIEKVGFYQRFLNELKQEV